MNVGDMLLIGSFDDADRARKELDRDIELMRESLRELERQRGKLLELGKSLCKHARTYVNRSSATSSPRIRKNLNWAHSVYCCACGKVVDEVEPEENWHND